MTEQQPLQGLRVMVVEDDYYLATDSCEWLEEAGAQIIGPAGTMDEVERLLAADRPDVVLLDINLGGGPAYELPRMLGGSHLPFLFATGYDRAVIPPEFKNVPRLEKPYQPDTLIAAVRAIACSSQPDVG